MVLPESGTITISDISTQDTIKDLLLPDAVTGAVSISINKKHLFMISNGHTYYTPAAELTKTS